MMSQPNNNMSVIKASIDYLSSKFDQLLDDHQNILMKQRQDNANIMNQKHGVDPKLFNNLFQEQEHLQNSIEFLAQLEESYHNEARHLKDLIIDDFQNFRHSNQSSDKGLRDPITALKSYIEINLGSLQTKVLSADGMEQLEIQVMRKLQAYFNEAFNGMEEAFMNYSNMSKKSSGKNSQQYDPIQIEQFCSHNFLTIESAAGSLDSIQQIIIDHNDAMGSLSSKYKKESKLLQENLNHIKQRLYVKTKETSEHRTSLRSSSGLKQDRSAEKSTKTAFDSKELLLMDQLVTQVIATNAYKNEVFNAIKKADDSLQFRLQEKIDNLTGNLRTLKEAGGALRESVVEERRSAKKSVTPPRRIARCPSQEMSFVDQSSKKKRIVGAGGGSVEKREQQKKPSPSPIRSKSPQQPQEKKIYKTKSVGKLHQDNSRLSDKDVDLLAKELRKCQNQFESYSNTMDQKLLKLHYNAQKFLNSSEKIAELVNRRGEEEIYALKIYQHDYTILRDSLAKLFVSHEAHQERRNSPTRSASQELLKQRERSAKRLAPHLHTEQSREESMEREKSREEGNDRKIEEIMQNLGKAQTDILKTIYRDESYIHKTLETEEDFQLRGREKGSQSKLKTDKSQQELLGKFSQGDLEKKYEKLVLESDILKKENEELYKKARKVREKADERKKTLKQLFELVMEKDKDINIYKEALKGKGEGIQKKKDDIVKAFEAKSNELFLKVGYLEKKLLDKEFKLRSLTELAQKLMQTRQIKESKSAKSGIRLPKSGSRDDLRDSGKKKQSPEIKGKSILDDDVVEIKNYVNKETDNLLSLINPKDMATVEQSLEVLKVEKKELEEKYHQMLEEMGRIHEDKSKLESEHQQEISQLREKVKNLHEKVQIDDHFKTPQKPSKVEEIVQEATVNSKVKEALNERILELSKDIREGVEEYRRNPVESAEKSQHSLDEITELKKINEDLTVEKDKEISSLNELVSILRREIEDINEKYSMKQEPLVKDNKALKAQIETLNMKVNGIFEWMKEDYKGPSSAFIEENLEKLQVIIKQRENAQKETIEKIHSKVKEDQAREGEKLRVLKEENNKIIAENNEKIKQLEGLKSQLDGRIQEHEDKIKELKQKIIEYEVANIELEQAMSILKEDLQSKEDSIDTQRKDLTAKITELEVLVENYKNAVGSQNNELADKNVKLETKIKELEELVAKKEAEIESKKKNLAMKNLEVQSLSERLTGSESTLQIYKHDLKTQEKELEIKTKEYENNIHDLNVQIEAYKKEVESENKKRNILEEKILKLEGSMENVRKEKSSKDNDYELKIQDYESRIQDLESTKEAQKLDIISLANDLNTQKDSFIDNIQELEKTIESLKEETSLKTEKFIQELAVYQAKIQELETNNESQKAGHQKLSEAINIKENDLKQQKENYVVKLSNLQEELKKANQSYEESMNAKVNDLKQQKEVYETKLTELESERANIEQELKESKAGHQALIEAMNVKEYDLNHHKQGSEAKIDELQSQKMTLEQELRGAHARYETKISELEASISTFKEEIILKNQTIQAYQKQIKDFQAKNETQIFDIQSRNSDLDSQSKELRKKLSDYEVSISIYKEEVAVKDKNLTSQTKEIEELKEKLKFKQAEIIAMDLDNQGLIKRLNTTEEEKTKTETVLNLFDSSLSEFTNRYIAPTEEQEEKSLQDFENNLQKRMEQLKDLVQNRQLELEDLTKMSEKERELLKADKENLERRVQDIEMNIARTIATCERLENETQILNEKNSELLTAKDRLEQELEKREVDVKSLTEELQVLREAIRSAQEENAKIMEGANEEEDQQREIEIMRDFREGRVLELEQRIIEMEEMYNEKEKYAREVEVRCQGITDVLEELGEQRKKFIQDKNEERTRYEKKIKELKEEITRMTEEQENVIKMKKLTPSELDTENQKRLEENIKELNAEKEALQAELNKKNEDILYMREKSDNLQAALQNAGKRISQLIEEKEELEKGIPEVDSQQGFDSMIEIDDRDRIIEELKQSNEENLEQLDDALAKNQQLQEKIQTLEANNENSKSVFEKKEVELRNRIESLLQEVLNAENDIEALKTEQEDLTSQLKVSSEVLAEKEQVIAELNIAVQGKEDKIKELRESSQKDNQALFQENDQLKEETKNKQLKIQELEEELEQLSGRWDEVKERIEELQTSLSHKDSLIVEINNLNSEVSEQVKKLQEEIVENKKANSADIEALNSKYEQEVQKLETVEKENIHFKEEIANLNQTLQEKYKITVEYTDHKEEIETKDQKISELQKQVQELQENLKTEASQKEILDTTIAELRREIEGDTGDRLSQRDLHIDELTQRIATLEKSQLELGEENRVLRSLTQRETRTRSGDFNLDKSEIMCTSPNAEDDIKTKSYLTGNILNRSFDLNTKRLSEEEYIKDLHEKTRTLQDENEKLEAENKQLKSEHELSRIMDEDLRSDLVDKDEEMKRLQFQLVVLKEELSKADKKSQSQDSSPMMAAPQSSISHEKEHIRTIFSKFMESLSQGNSKEVEGLLKLLTSLLDFDETAKGQLMNGLKSKSSKKGMFGKLF